MCYNGVNSIIFLKIIISNVFGVDDRGLLQSANFRPCLVYSNYPHCMNCIYVTSLTTTTTRKRSIFFSKNELIFVRSAEFDPNSAGQPVMTRSTIGDPMETALLR